MKIEDINERINRFFLSLESTMDIAAQQLHERYLFQRKALKKQFPLLMSGMWNGSDNLNDNDEIGDILKTGTLSIGFIGLAEALIALIGKHHGESDEAQALGLKIVKFMRDRVDYYADKYDLNYTLLGTPAEGLSGTFIKKDKEQYGEIKGITDKDYYTNSSHIPVYYHCTISHKAKIEGPYHEIENAGHIFYVEVDSDITKNPEVVETINEIAMKNNMGYWAINHNQARCPKCNWETLEKDVYNCKKCNTQMSILQRITGYLVSTVDKWNSAKSAELKDRINHN